MCRKMNLRSTAALTGLILYLVMQSLPYATGRDIIAGLNPAEFAPGTGSLQAGKSELGGVVFTLPFETGTDRFFWDIPIRPPRPDSTAIIIEFTCAAPEAIRSLTLHLKDGENWLSAAVTPHAHIGEMLTLNRGDFQAESGSPQWHKADKLRLSFWREDDFPTAFHLHSLRETTPAIAIIRGGDQTAPGESALAAQCAARAARLFRRAGLPAVIVEDNLEALDTAALRWIVLPYNPALNNRQINLLERFVERHNGRIAVFYNSNRRLASLVNVRLMPYSTQSQPWNTVEFVKDSIPYLPETMPHFTSHLLPVAASGKNSVTTGYWRTIDGFRDTSLPAAAQSINGLWFSHIPPLATPSAAQWLAAQLAASDPELMPAIERLQDNIDKRDATARRTAGLLPAVTNEIRGVWSRSIPARQREQFMRQLATLGVNAVFEHVGAAGRLRERPAGGLSAGSTGSRRMQSMLAGITSFAHRHNLEMHAWVTLFNAEELPEPTLARLRAENRLMVTSTGETLPWLCPSHPANRAMLLEKLVTLAATGIDGIHLDYVRYPGNQGCYSRASRQSFEKRQENLVENWPADVLPDGVLADAYQDFRRNEITSFVSEAVNTIRRKAPAVKISAAVFPTEAAAAENAQDWPSWLRDDLLDFICPMLYTQSTALFRNNTEAAIKYAKEPARILPGIGVTADESQLDALATIEQINAARQLAAGGFVLFQLDIELLDRILPVLSLEK